MNNEANIQEMVTLSGKTPDNDRVILTREEVEASEANRKKIKKTIRQLPVFRSASNICYCIAEIEMKCPRKCRCMVDELESLTSEMLTLISLANEFISQRREYLIQAQCVMNTIMVKLDVIYNIHVIGKDQRNKIKKLGESVMAQIIGWRNSVNTEGMQREA